MPSSYAHYRFGQRALPTLPDPVRRLGQQFRQLYDVGLHGPDLLFYYQPLFRTKIGALGSHYHKFTGREFFQQAAEHLHKDPSDGALAYLYGVLGHYALDSACHPLVLETAAEGKIGHVELETEFDRYLLTQDGVENPHTRNLASHVRLTWGEAVTVSGFYPPAGPYAIRRSTAIMAGINRMLAMRNRKLLTSMLRLGGEDGLQLAMSPRPSRKCAPLMQPLAILYDEAMTRYPRMAAQLADHIANGGPLGEEFDHPFG